MLIRNAKGHWGLPVTIEVNAGKPANLEQHRGLPDAAVKESLDRVSSVHKRGFEMRDSDDH